MATHPTTDCDIHADERLIFFPTIGHFDSRDGWWHLPIHGWVFKPENDSLRRAAAIGLLRRWLGVERSGLEADLFVDRLAPFWSTINRTRGSRFVSRRRATSWPDRPQTATFSTCCALHLRSSTPRCAATRSFRPRRRA